MSGLIVNWLLSALSLVIVAHVIRGFEVSGFGTALLAAIAVGLANATLGVFLKIVTFPVAILTLGVFWLAAFWLVINALMLEFAAALVPGFAIRGFVPAFIGAIVLSLVNVGLHYVVRAS